MGEFSLTASQRRTAKKRENKRRQQAKGTPTVHPPQTRPDPQGDASVLRQTVRVVRR